MNKKILIVEDEKTVINTMKAFLHTDFQVTFVEDLIQAQKALELNSFDLVVTDFNFPGGNGDDVAHLAKTKGIRVVLHSGQCSDAKGEYAHKYDKMDADFMNGMMSGNL